MDLSLLATLTSRHVKQATLANIPPLIILSDLVGRFPLTSCIHDCTYIFSPNELPPEIVTYVTGGVTL